MLIKLFACGKRAGWRKTLWMMKWTTILLLATALQVSAKGYAQRITLSLKDAPLLSVFKEIEKQTGYSFLYTQTDLDKSHKIDIEVKAMALEEVLKICFRDQPLAYTIRDKFIVVREQEKMTTKVDNRTEPVSPPGIDIKGRVLSESNEPVAGASITIKGDNTKGTTTNEDGFFELQGVDAAATLVISGTAIEIVEIKLNGRTYINVTAKIKIQEQEEVIINAGYYQVKKGEQTGSISRVSAKTIEKQPVLNPLAAIQGRMTGVSLQQTTGVPGGDFKIEIRGRNSLRIENGIPVGNDPLYVIDGVPFSMEKVSSSNNAGGILGSGASPLAGINNADIESIEILKDADATAIYGSRGANGVVLITTKRGKAGKTKLSLDLYTGGGKARKLNLLNTEQYLAMRREAFANDGYTTYPSDAYDVNGTWDQTRYTDWQKVLIGGTAQSTSIQASLAGGSEGTNFLFSAGYRNEGSVFPGDFAYTKASSHFFLNHRSPNKKLTINVSFTGTADKNNQVSLDYLNTSRRLAPDAPTLYQQDGSLNWENSTWQNPLSALVRSYTANVNTFISNAVIGYELLPGLQVKSSFGYTQVVSKENTLNPSTYFDPALNFTSKRSNVIISNGTNQSWIIEPQLSYERNLGPGQLSALVGTSFQRQQLDRSSDQYSDFPSNNMLGNLPAAAQQLSFEFIKSGYRYCAIYGRINYNVDKKYILNLTGRRDGSSRFGPGRQFANFGAAGLAWIFSKEIWVSKHFPILSFGKLRASYGTTGNDQIPDYYFLDTYAATTLYDGSAGLMPSRLFNANFAWETNKKLEAALDLGFFRDRISLSVSWYRNRSSNQLVNYTLPLTSGFNGILANLPATVQNTGLEFELNTNNIQRKNLRWTSSFNLTIPDNKLVEFPNIESSTYANTYIVGQSIYIKQVYESTGVDPVTGYFTFRDYNGDGKITTPDDNKKAVLVGQDLFGGFNNTLNYKGWSLDIFFQFVKQRGYNYWYAGPTPGVMANQAAFVLDKPRWQKTGDVIGIQRLATEYNAAAGNALLLYRQSDGAISDASYIRLKNVALSYQFTGKWVKGFTCRAYLQAQNLLVISGYEGYDPESQFTRLPPLKMFTGGIQISL